MFWIRNSLILRQLIWLHQWEHLLFLWNISIIQQMFLLSRNQTFFLLNPLPPPNIYRILSLIILSFHSYFQSLIKHPKIVNLSLNPKEAIIFILIRLYRNYSPNSIQLILANESSFLLPWVKVSNRIGARSWIWWSSSLLLEDIWQYI